MTKSVNLIIANMGSVESSYASFLMFLNTSNETFSSGIEAVTNLAECFLAKYIYSFDTYPPDKKCCKDFLQNMKPNDNYCSQCGENLKDIKSIFNLKHFEGFIKNHLLNDMDQYGDLISQYGVWDEMIDITMILKVVPETVIQIPHYAERVITKSLVGNEFDDPNHGYHFLANPFKKSVSDYGIPWGNGPKTREELADFLESECRITKE